VKQLTTLWKISALVLVGAVFFYAYTAFNLKRYQPASTIQIPDQIPSPEPSLAPSEIPNGIIEGKVVNVLGKSLEIEGTRGVEGKITIKALDKVLIGPKMTEKQASPSGKKVLVPGQKQEYLDFTPLSIGDYVIISLDQNINDQFIALSVTKL
jgi:hypothetical protein